MYSELWTEGYKASRACTDAGRNSTTTHDSLHS